MNTLNNVGEVIQSNQTESKDKELKTGEFSGQAVMNIEALIRESDQALDLVMKEAVVAETAQVKRIRKPKKVDPEAEARRMKYRGMTGMERLIDTFLHGGKRTVQGQFRIEGDKILHTNSFGRNSLIAMKVKNGKSVIAIGNSSILPNVGGRSAWGSYQSNRSVHPIQLAMQGLMPMIPFSAFEEAKLDLNLIKILDQSGAEEVTRTMPNPAYDSYDDRRKRLPKNITETVHFTGASLFSIGSKRFLFDLDRREIEHKVFNPFMAEINSKVNTIAEAYVALKPEAVLRAEKKGLKVLRQGEWFFIPVKAPRLKNQASLKRELKAIGKKLDGVSWDKEREIRKSQLTVQEQIPGRMELRAGPNRPNVCSKAVRVGKVVYCSGKVEHSGREHFDLDLGIKWYLPVANTAIRSVTITGDVD